MTYLQNGKEFPEPGEWSVNWVEGDVVSYRHGDEDDRIHDGDVAHVFTTHDGFGKTGYRVQVNGETVDTIDAVPFEDAFDRVADILREHA